ncbi:hypothetical protein [Tumebacillus lipolyticus]|uniref:Uncharacterized protein n=1 Tax=Tumebacillus lipolyticus TaxID=1280370 RepID=A0ABW4ZVZ5_9BACL
MKSEPILQAYQSDTGETFVLAPTKEETATDRAELHNLIAQLLVDDARDGHRD